MPLKSIKAESLEPVLTQQNTSSDQGLHCLLTVVFMKNRIKMKKINHLGPVVQSIVSLTTSLRRQLVKYMWTTLSNMLLFFVGKM